jgi:Delta3-Delta2-enoyl-CoA isomerase
MAAPPVGADLPGLSLTYPGRGVAHLSICAPPANALNLALWRSLAAALRRVESDGATSVLVISSGLRRPVFSAGNDVAELHAPSTTEARFKEFWVTSTTFLAALHASTLRTIAAVRGACPAGGCVIALCCDERVVLRCPAFTFGLNEAALGIPVPTHWAQLMLTVGGARAAVERMLYSGRMADVDAALRLGLVDRAVDGGRGDLMAAAEEMAVAAAAETAGGRGAGFRLTKKAVRGPFSAAWSSFAEEEARQSWAMLSSDAVAAQLGRVLAQLRGGRRGAPAEAKL